MGGVRGRPGRVGGEVALLGPHLMNAAGYEFPQTHKRVGTERKVKGVVERGRVIQAPGIEHEKTGLGLKGEVSGLQDAVWRERRKVRVE